MATACLAAIVLSVPQTGSGWVSVDGRRVLVHGGNPTVAAALRAAHRPARNGVVLSAASGRPLAGHRTPPLLLVDGRPAGLRTRVGAGEDIVAVDGPAVVEPVVDTEVPIPPSGLPDVERELWHPGRPGAGIASIGTVSGEQVGPVRVKVPAIPASPETNNVVALTFDDGPNPVWTPQILQVLADEHVPAMFCMVGYAIGWDPARARTIVDQGNTPCDHTAHHVEFLDHKHRDQVEQEVDEGADDVQRAIGRAPAFFRPPGGAISPDIVDVAHRRHMRVVTWTVDPDDFRAPRAPVLLGRILGRVRPGAIVLLHDGGGNRSQTAGMLRALIDELKARCYTFTTPALETEVQEPPLPCAPPPPPPAPPSPAPPAEPAPTAPGAPPAPPA